ncbi:hypothetical protein C0J52_19601, partial [Blattella germanica]
VPDRTTICRLFKKFNETGSVANKKPRVNKRVLTEEKLDEIAFRLEISSRKSLRRLAQEVGVSKTSVQHATKLLKLKPYKTRVVHQLLPTDDAGRRNFCNWYLQAIHDGVVDPTLVFFSDETWFHLSGYDGTINAQRYVDLILQPFFAELTEEERDHAYFMQDNATAHTAHISMREIVDVFEDRIVSRGLWSPRSPDINPCDFYLWGKLKSVVYANNPHTLDELKENIRQEIRNISRDELLKVSANVLKRCEACLNARGHHFQHLQQ